MKVVTSGRVEHLAGELCASLNDGCYDPFQPDVVLVHSQGMGTWLAQQVARHHGVFANIKFVYPKSYVPQLILELTGRDDGALDGWRQEVLEWRIAKTLPELVATGEHSDLSAYLASDSNNIKRFGLAQRMATLFDGYQNYRRLLTESWSQGEEKHWQAALWRGLVGEVEERPIPVVAAEAISVLSQRDCVLPTSLPPRLFLFGISTTPPLHLDVLQALSHHIPVTLFLLSPTHHYWADIRSRRTQLRLIDPHQPHPIHFDEGHPLLASMGHVGRDFQSLLLARGESPEVVQPLRQADAPTHMLGCLQSDIANLVVRSPAAGSEEPPVENADRSISMHACHSPMRQVETLRDLLLQLFSDEADLNPEDVIVMTPDLDTYAPLIDAVFATSAGKGQLPYRIADRSIRRENGVAHALLQFLQLIGSRLEAGAILDCLALAPIAKHFDLSEDDLARVATWVRESGIRWGMDEHHRQSMGQPSDRGNTWAFGLDRLLLGYSMPSESTKLMQGVMPYDGAEGHGAAALGALAHFISLIEQIEQRFTGSRTMAEWEHGVGGLLEELVAVGPEDDWQIQQCRQALAILRERTEKAAFTEAIELETFLRYLSQHFDSTRSPHGFLSGGITFCAMLPMRSIPFEVVVLLGMDEGVFPGPDPVLTFDLMAQHPKPGDRSRRRDDRYLFLEAILSARKKLIITYTGFEAHDGEPRPPSTVVSELIDVLADSFHCPDQDGANLRDRAESYLIVQHPLQPFGVTLFTAETEHRSFDSLFLRGAQALYGPTSTPRAFVDRPLGEEEREPITPDALIRFFKRPLETFLEQRLGVRLRDYSEVQPEREPIIMDSLDQWSLQSLILEGLVAGTRSADMLALLRASGDLPLGDLGNEVFRKGFNQVHPVAERYRSLVGDASRETLAVDLAVGDDTIKGTLSDVHAGGMVSFTASKMKIELKLEGWLKHLVLSCVRSVPQQSLVCARWGKGETKIARFKPLQDPGACLAQLVKLYRAGMQEPLHFFPGPAERYAKKLSQNEPAAGLAAAKRDWFKTAFGQGSSIADSEVVQLLLPNRCPIDEEFQPGGLPSSPDLTFQKIAAVVYLPLFEHLEETS